jgi:hypothetical protein
MRFPRTKSEPERLADTVGGSLAAIGSGMNRGRVVKAGLIAGGVAALTAGSAAISSLRRRIGERPS